MGIITVSRGSFAGGRAIAEKLQQTLGYPSLSREQVLTQAAQEYGILESELSKSLNEVPSFWQQASGKRLAYVKCVTAVLLDHASQGNLVYHGNVGHLLLSGVPHVLRVRVVADMEYRIRAAMAQVNLSRDAAIAHIRRVDEERSRWARLLYGVDWEDPTQYHLTVNLGLVSAASACETIVRLAAMPEFVPTAEGQREYDDLRLSCRVWGSLARNPGTRSASLRVQAKSGEVVISGSVPSTQALELIPRVVSEVPGVQSIKVEAGMGTDWYW